MDYGFDTSFNMTGPSIGQAYDAAKDKNWSDIFSAGSSSSPKNDWLTAFTKAATWLGDKNDRDKYQNQAATPSFFNSNRDAKDKSQSPFKLADDISILPGTQAGQFTLPGAPGKSGVGKDIGRIAGAGLGLIFGGPPGMMAGSEIGAAIGGAGDNIFMA